MELTIVGCCVSGLVMIYTAGKAVQYRLESKHYRKEMSNLTQALVHRVNDVTERDREIARLNWQLEGLLATTGPLLLKGASDGEASR